MRRDRGSATGGSLIAGGDSLIFDLDGTLVDSSAFEDECYVGALRDVLGDVTIDPDWSGYRHVTDRGILTELTAALGRVERESVIARVRAAFGRRVASYFDAGGTCPAIPGARETLVCLIENGFRVGIATGGWRHTAVMKLEQAGIDTAALVVSCCDDALDRVGIMSDCLKKLGGDESRVVYFGDGLWDLAATAALGWRFVGVGRRLSGECENWIADFQDPAWPLSPDTA